MCVPVVPLALILLRRVMPRLEMPIAIVPETIVADGVPAPIRMASFPSMETLQPVRFSDHPDIAGTQITILVANDADVFVAIPDVIIGDHYWFRNHHRRRGWRDRNYWKSERHLPIWLNYAASHHG